jgi:hypothetical protein
MKRIHIADAEIVILALQDEIRRSDESRYDHRLHGLLMVAQGLSCTEVVSGGVSCLHSRPMEMGASTCVDLRTFGPLSMKGSSDSTCRDKGSSLRLTVLSCQAYLTSLSQEAWVATQTKGGGGQGPQRDAWLPGPGVLSD